MRPYAGSGGASAPTVHFHGAIGSFSKGSASIGRIKNLGRCEILQRAGEFLRRLLMFFFWGGGRLMGMFLWDSAGFRVMIAVDNA